MEQTDLRQKTKVHVVDYSPQLFLFVNRLYFLIYLVTKANGKTFASNFTFLEISID